MGLSPELLQLLAPAAYPHDVERVQLVETPISWVLLTGRYAYKLKRPVMLEYVDQRSAPRRAALCIEEVRLNRRFAPQLYLGVRAIRRVGNVLRVDGATAGDGEVIEHAVCMRQFDPREELDRLVAAGAVDAGELAAFGRELAGVHAGLAPVAPGEPWGTAERVAELVRANFEQCMHAARALGTGTEVAALRAPLGQRLDADAGLLGARRAAGCVRECHGDLHTRNIVRDSGRLLAFDCVEFEPGFRWIDVADDVAFLVADLQTQGAPRLAQAFLQAWLETGGDWQGCRLLPLYQAHRALVRAKVAALSISSDADAAAALRRAHARYLAHAGAVLHPGQPAVLLMCGLSGSGKTWLAARLAPELDALHLRSDIERKRAAGLGPQASSGSGVARALYAPEASASLYRRLLESTSDILAGGRSVLVDATFLRAADRHAWRELAMAAGSPFRVIHCRAPPEVLQHRIRQRCAAASDASEADLEVLQWQRGQLLPFGPDESATVIEVDTSHAEALDTGLQALRTVLAPSPARS
ncbi:MAG: AAA family ATPase [Gammaproteobacteria bacterium]|nr:AAA family ATPase [Gammaproteobacteria bacterium]